MNAKLAFVVFACLAVTPALGADNALSHDAIVEHGRYLIKISGCNDCHTDGYILNDGSTPSSEWLKGDTMGWSGPWGTTYGSNLRLFMANLTESQWLVTAKNLRARPPMPWFNLNAMSDRDLSAIYHFVRSLGDPGSPARSALPPGEQAPSPYALFQ